MRIVSWRTYGNDWESLDWSCIQKRRAGSSSGGLPKRTGDVEEKTNPRRSISWASNISVGRTGSGDSQCDARPSASACERTATDQAGAPQAHARSRAPNWRMAQIGRAGLLQLLCGARKPQKASRCSGTDCWDCGGAHFAAGANSIDSPGPARLRWANDGFLNRECSIPIPLIASPPVIRDKNRMR